EDGPGGIHFNDAVLARDAGLVALAVILFEGGVLADLPEIRRGRAPAVALATLGVVVTGLGGGGGTRVGGGGGWATSLLVGAGDAAILLGREFVSGVAGGVAVGLAAAALLRRLPLPSAGLAPVVALGVALAGYVGVSLAGGSGLLTVYLAGLLMGDAKIPHA